MATRSGGVGAGWLGIDFQSRPGGPTNGSCSTRMLSPEVQDQELALKTLGINLIHAPELHLDPETRDMSAFLMAITDGILHGAISIDYVEHKGPDPAAWNVDAMLLELLSRGLCDCLVFSATALDHFYRRENVVRPDHDLENANMVHLDLHRFEKGRAVDRARLFRRIGELDDRGIDVVLIRHHELRELIDTFRLEVLPGPDPIEPNNASGSGCSRRRARGVSSSPSEGSGLRRHFEGEGHGVAIHCDNPRRELHAVRGSGDDPVSDLIFTRRKLRARKDVDTILFFAHPIDDSSRRRDRIGSRG